MTGQRLMAAFPLLKEPELVLLPAFSLRKEKKQRLGDPQRSREKEKESEKQNKMETNY